ncbi:MAG TPA: hypothetical protein VF897_00890 [Roseiflexaceae bacterium]
MPAHQEYKLALQSLQSNRLRRDLADLEANPEYQQVGEFVFTEIYGPRDFQVRDAQARRLHRLVHMVPGLAVRHVEQALQLLELTNTLDDAVVACLIAIDAPVDFDEATYDRAYRLADNYAERVQQLTLIHTALLGVYRMARKPLLGAALQHSAGMAQAAGMADIHRFLYLGYRAIQPVRNIEHFVDTIDRRERDRLDRIYGLAALA